MSNPYFVRLHVILAGDDNAATVYPPGASVSTVESLVGQLNVLFAHVGVQFRFDASTDLEEMRNTIVNNDSLKESNLANAMERHRIARKYSAKVVLLFRNGLDQAAANFSSGTEYLVVLHSLALASPRIVMHELGHYFHLMHTWDAPSKEEVKNRIRTYIEDEGHSLSEGLKALEIWDADTANVQDTPYDLCDQIYDDPQDKCRDNADVTFEVVFANGGTGHPYVPSKEYTYTPRNRSNPMSCFLDCGFPLAFSEGQQAVIHNALLSGNRIRLLKGGSWNSASEQEFVSPAAVSRNLGTVTVYACSPDGQVMTKVWDDSRSSYWPSNTSWFSLGGSGYITPAAVSRKPDTIDLLARDIKGIVHSKVWSASLSGYYPKDNEWLHLLGEDGWIDAGPALLARHADALEVFVRWIDGTIRRKLWMAETQKWSDSWQNLGGAGVGSPVAVARRPELIDLYTRWSDGSIRSKVWRAADNSWYPGEKEWINLAGKGYDSPTAVARRPDKIDLFMRWSDGTIRTKTWDDSRDSYWPGTTKWHNLGGQAASKPVAVCRNPASIALFARWVDGTVRMKAWDDSRDSWWPGNSAWSNLGGDILGVPAVVNQGENRIVVYCRWNDGTIRSKVWNAETSEWWPGQMEWFSLGQP